MFQIHTDKDIRIVDGIVEVFTQRENIVIPLHTIDHILFKKQYEKLDKHYPNAIILFNDKHTEIYTITISDNILAERIYYVLSQNIKERSMNYNVMHEARL